MEWPVRKAPFPLESRLYPGLARAGFHDAWETDLHDASLAPIDIAQRALAATPGWVEALLRLRNAMARPFGVRPVPPLGGLRKPLGGWAPGDKFGMFKVESMDETELVLGINDSHLDVRISFLIRRRERPSYLIASLVEIHNLVGRIYMWPVSVVHPLLVIGMMRRLPM